MSPPPTIWCAGCGHLWTALGAAHCTACHEHFGSVSAFDRHRGAAGERGHCHDPAAVGLVRRDGAWRGEPMPAEALALRGAA
ncbi:hypothetical protein [Pseudonocardia sp. H11422]|uniref:FDXHR family putative zinc-binding protein n=1 Tax=Pseudonocardia sp. H11422 TaxID=2835866 RepID=UPI001BDD20B4|nr:hypothetical protein [Pseudonocardia sp. H11422]